MRNSNAIVASVVARFLSDAEFHRDVLSEPGKHLELSGLPPSIQGGFERFDFQRLANFGGLITQTQHNFLWEILPCTRALLKYHGLEISIFAQYRRHCLDFPAGKLSRNQKIERFSGYLRELLMHSPDDSALGVADILAHELSIWEVSQQIAGQDAELTSVTDCQTTNSAREFDRLVPALDPRTRLLSFRYDPQAIVSLIKRGQFGLRPLRRRTVYVGYFVDVRDASFKIVKLTRPVWRLLQECDGRRTTASVLRRLCPHTSGTRRDLRRILASTCANGLVAMREAHATHLG